MRQPPWSLGPLLVALIAVNCGGSTGNDTGAGSAGASGSGAADGAPCSPSLTCTGASFCDHPFNDCGKFAGIPVPGTCTPRPQACDAISQPACGCDGHIYDSPCDAERAGADLDALGACTPPSGEIPCGWMFCDPKTTYCRAVRGDTSPSDYSCEPLPASCQASLSCSCFDPGTACNTDCSVVSGDGVQGFRLACGAGPF